MIGYLVGEVIFSDGKELILKTKDGIGHQVFMKSLFVEGSLAEIFVSHIFRETGQELFGFQTLREKKLFELLNSVKGVGPKSSYALLSSLGADTIIQSVQMENKKVLTKAPGVGAKAAAQICLDLGNKIQKVLMYSARRSQERAQTSDAWDGEDKEHQEELPLNSEMNLLNSSNPSSLLISSLEGTILEETIMACKELGFKEEIILPMAQKILTEKDIQKSEQLVHLVLKGV